MARFKKTLTTILGVVVLYFVVFLATDATYAVANTQDNVHEKSFDIDVKAPLVASGAIGLVVFALLLFYVYRADKTNDPSLPVKYLIRWCLLLGILAMALSFAFLPGVCITIPAPRSPDTNGVLLGGDDFVEVPYNAIWVHVALIVLVLAVFGYGARRILVYKGKSHLNTKSYSDTIRNAFCAKNPSKCDISLKK